MTEKKCLGEGAVDLRRSSDPYAARVEGGRLRVDAPTGLPDGTKVQLDVCLDSSEDELAADQRAGTARYEGRIYAGTVRNGRLLVDEPTALPDGIRISVVEDWPLPPEERARLEAALAESQRDFEAGRCMDVDEVLKEMRIAGALTPAERDKFEAEYRLEIEKRFQQALPGGYVTMEDFLARWKKSR